MSSSLLLNVPTMIARLGSKFRRSHFPHVYIMSAPVTAKSAENTAKPEDTKTAPQLGALEEDDEFEEFAAEGKG